MLYVYSFVLFYQIFHLMMCWKCGRIPPCLLTSSYLLLYQMRSCPNPLKLGKVDGVTIIGSFDPYHIHLPVVVASSGWRNQFRLVGGSTSIWFRRTCVTSGSGSDTTAGGSYITPVYGCLLQQREYQAWRAWRLQRWTSSEEGSRGELWPLLFL